MKKALLVLALAGVVLWAAACAPATPGVHVSPLDVTRVPFTTQVYFLIERDSPLQSMPGFEITFTDGRQTRTVAQKDWVDQGDRGCCLEAGLYQTSSRGDLTITMTLGEGETRSVAGTYAVPLAQDRVLAFRLFVTDRDPTLGCFGCAGSQSYPLDAKLKLPPEYRLWIVYGFNSISRPVVY